MGKVIILIGLGLVVLGCLVQFAPGFLSWFGRLPGDVRYDSGRTKVFFPITSVILVSVVVTILLNLLRK